MFKDNNLNKAAWIIRQYSNFYRKIITEWSRLPGKRLHKWQTKNLNNFWRTKHYENDVRLFLADFQQPPFVLLYLSRSLNTLQIISMGSLHPPSDAAPHGLKGNSCLLSWPTKYHMEALFPPHIFKEVYNNSNYNSHAFCC